MMSHRPLTSIPLTSTLSLTRTLHHRHLPSIHSHSHLTRSFHTSRPSLLHDPIRMPNDGTTKRGRRLLEIAHIQQKAITTAEQALKTSITPQEIARINETGVEKVHRILREAQIAPQYWKQPPSVMDEATTSASDPTSTTSSTSTSTSPSRIRSTLAATVADMNSTTSTSTHDPYLDEEAEFSVDEDADTAEPPEEQVEDDSGKNLSTAIIRVKKIDQWGRAYGSGGRKTATSRVWIKPGTGEFTVNYRPHTEYFHNTRHRFAMFYPFMISNTVGQFDVFATVKGGGLNGQAEAVRHGIARALQNYDPAHRPALKKAHLLTRDNRQVERKKPGRYKARKGYTFVKR